MLAIRLTRTGKIHAPHYRIVVQEKRSKLNGKAIDTIGHYHPAQANKELVIDAEKAKVWMDKGAQTSDTVTNLFVKAGILDESCKIRTFYTPKPKEVVAEEPVSAPAPEEVAEETEGATEEAAPVTEDATPDAAEPAEEAPAVVEEPVEETPTEPVDAPDAE